MNAEAAGHIGAGGGHEAMNIAVAGGVELLAAAEAGQQQQHGNTAAGQQGDPTNEEMEMSNEENNEADATATANTTSSSSGTGTGTTATSRYSLRKRSRLPLQSLLLSGDGNTTAATATTVTATAKNISTTATIGFTYADTMTDREFERLLARHEERGVHERSEKRLRLERGYGDDDYPCQPPAEGCPAFDALPKEAIRLVFEMLPSARAVFNLAYQSKYMLSFVEKRVSFVAVW